VFENRALRRIFGPQRDEVTGEWRKLHIEELNYLYCSPNIFRVVQSRMNYISRACRTYGGKERFIQGFGGKPERMRPFERPRRRGEDNIKTVLLEVGCGVWTGSERLRIGTGDGHL
jgi:PAS domain-containing protein